MRNKYRMPELNIYRMKVFVHSVLKRFNTFTLLSAVILSRQTKI